MAKSEDLFADYAAYGLSVSAGAAYGTDYESLYKKADSCLYRAKEAGRNRFVIEGLEDEAKETEE